MKKNYESEGSEDIVSESDGNQSISREGKKEEVVSTVDTTYGWENVTLSKRVDEWKSEDEPFVGNLVEEMIQQMAH